MPNPEAPPSLLSAENLVLRYGNSTVVSDASIQLVPGQVTALVGPNGSGKSTFLRSLARLHRIGEGNITLAGRDGHPAREISLVNGREFAREVTLFSQSHPSPDGLSVNEVVAFGRHPHRRGFSGLTVADRGAIERAMRITGVQAMANRAAGELSGGELQRVWLAVCLAQETSVVLLDEPTNHLDLRYQVETLDLVRDLADDGRTAVGIVLHDLDHAAQIADMLVLMKDGRIHAAGTPSKVLTAANLSEVYEIEVQVRADASSGRLRIDPVGRKRARPGPSP